MGYCVLADVQAEFKNITFNSGSNVTDTAVNGFIAQASALIDSYIGQRWVTPLTGDTSTLALMTLYCSTLVAERVRGIMANKQTTNTDANQNVKMMGLSTSDVMKALQNIALGNQTLSGASLLLAGAGFVSNNFNNSAQARFKKNRKQW